MLTEKSGHACNPAALRKFVQWSITLAQADDLMLVCDQRKQFAKSPDTALVDNGLRKTTLSPVRFQALGGNAGRGPGGIGDLK